MSRRTLSELKTDPAVLERVRAAVAAYKALPPVDRALEETAQKQSFVRGMVDHQPAFDDAQSVLAAEVIRLRARVALLENCLGPFSCGTGCQDGFCENRNQTKEACPRLAARALTPPPILEPTGATPDQPGR